MGTDRRGAFTLVEIAIAIAMSMIIVGTAIAAVRVCTTTITKARRLSLENSLLRAGALMGMDETDLWLSYDHPHDATRQPLRATGLPFNLAARDDERLVTDTWLPQLPQSWYRGFGYYNLSGQRVSRNYYRWGDYGLVASTMLPDDPVIAYKRSQGRAQKELATRLGYFGAMAVSAASTNWQWYESKGLRDMPLELVDAVENLEVYQIPLRFGVYAGEDAGHWNGYSANDRLIYVKDDGERMHAGDRRALTNVGMYLMTSADVATRYQVDANRMLTRNADGDHQVHGSAAEGNVDPADGLETLPYHFAWTVTRATIGDKGETIDEAKDLLARINSRDFSATQALAAGQVHRVLVGRGEIPEDWPRLDMRRISWFMRGRFGHWVRISMTDPLTGRQMALNLDVPGSTLYGARMHRRIIESGSGGP